MLRCSHHSDGFDGDARAVAPLHGDRAALVLRFAYVTGRVSAPLVTAVPPLKHGRGPRCHRRSRRGREAAGGQLRHINRPRTAGRSGAVGARPSGTAGSEVARLDLEDFDLRRGEVMIKAKGGHGDVMPLPVEVGEAVADYLWAGRPTLPAGRCF